MTAPTLYLTVGLPGTGKTTVARRLEAEHGALRLTKDEWVRALYGPENPPAASDVILDFGLWSRDERSCLRHAAAERGATAWLVYLDVDPAERRRRIAARQAAAPDTTSPMSEAELTAWAAVFDVPTPGELHGGEPVGEPPAAFASWDEWRQARWPPTGPRD